LLIVVAIFASVARRLKVPYPILLVLGGLVLGFVPGLPQVRLSPEIVFLLFLPALVYVSALFTSFRDFRANLRPISLLAFGLVIFTTCVVAVVAHAVIDGLAWPAAFVLGAIMSPTDAVAATVIAQRLGIPRRVVTILEGESLINDATGILLYGVAVSAVVGGSFSFSEASLQFVVDSIGAVLVGIVVGWIVVWMRRHLVEESSVLQNTISLLTPFVAYLPADRLGISGILAVVTTGLYMSWYGTAIVSPRTRLQGHAVWEMVDFLLNGLAFILLGLQLRRVLEGISGQSTSSLVLYAVLVSLTVIVVRLLWVFPAAYIPRFFSRRLRERDPYPPPWHVWVLGWTGMRGVISLAAALSLPLFTNSGEPFPQRDLIIFLTFCVILATLVVQGLTLPPLIRRLRVEEDGTGRQEEDQARVQITRAALARIDDLKNEDWVPDDTAERLRGDYDYRERRFAARSDGDETEEYEERSDAYKHFLRELLREQRSALVRMRNEGEISDEVLRHIQHDLDLEEERLEE
jgi:Na+/H+ antiporter